MPNHSYSTSLAHIFLCGICSWALKSTRFQQKLALVTFSFLEIHSLLGIFRYGHPIYGDKLRRLNQMLHTGATILPLPLINAQLFMDANDNLNLGLNKSTLVYGHICSAFIPIFFNTFVTRSSNRTFCLFLLGNITSLTLIGVLSENYWAIGLAFLTAANHFVLPELATTYQVPRTDLFTIGLCFTTMFGVNCLKDSPSGDFTLMKI